MIIGHVIRANFNAAYFFGPTRHGPLCRKCGNCLDFDYCPAQIDLHPSKRYGVSATYDGRIIYSREFASFCRDVLGSRQTFQPLRGGGQELFYMCPKEVLKFDPVRRGTEFGPVCNACGQHEWVAGATPAYLQQAIPIEDGFFRSDLTFGGGVRSFPLILISTAWKEALARQKFRGLSFRDVNGIEPSTS
jgi:hypothetical protein